jgi:F-type H+-transporting ATPase subunit delta
MTRRQIARGFVAQIQETSLKSATRSLAALMISEKMVKDIDLLVEEIRTELERSAGHIAADVTTARPLTSHLQQEISEMLKSKTSAKSVAINNIVDESIMGGFIARTSQYELDASVKGKLLQLKGVTR